MEKKILVETSARHIHVTKEHLEILFGKGYELTVKKMLSQPGQFACNERVDVVGEKGTIKGVSILGPVRPDTQVEVSATDARTLGVVAPIRESGDVAGSGACKLVGPAGEVSISQGVIIAKRHMHLTPAAAEEFGLKDKQICKIKLGGERALIFDEVVVRVKDSFAPAVHIDTDEANAAAFKGGEGIIVD
ncbi:MAG: phosphate propanoyltransferase [Ruminococcaceae bacterium]|nr:phosphate propanoyltransferase [Oscillospiraceae bacterium]